jgi:hypothetical protein
MTTAVTKRCNIKLIIRLDSNGISPVEQWWLSFVDGLNWCNFLRDQQHELRDIIFSLQGGDFEDCMYAQPRPYTPRYYHSYFLDGYKSMSKPIEKILSSFILQDGMTITAVYRQNAMIQCVNGPVGKILAKHWLIKQSPDFLMHHRWTWHREHTTAADDDPYTGDEYEYGSDEDNQDVEIINNDAN